MTSFAVLLLLCFLVDISSWRLSVFTAKTVSQSDHAPVRRRPSFGEVAPDCTDTRYRDSQGIRGRGLDIVAIASALVLSCMVDSSIAALPNTFNYEQGKLGFDYTEDLQRSSKPVKTHAVEVFFKSKGFKGFNVGVTVSIPLFC